MQNFKKIRQEIIIGVHNRIVAGGMTPELLDRLIGLQDMATHLPDKDMAFFLKSPDSNLSKWRRLLAPVIFK